MSATINTKDLEQGIIKCESCSYQMALTNYERLSVQKCPSCGHPNFIPAKISEYWLYKPLGGGGMGRVYKAIAISKNGEFAVKLLPGKTSTKSHLVENLVREAQTGIALGKHENIISILEYGESGDDFFIVSEFAEGERLDNLISAKKRFDEKETWQIALKIINAEMHIISKGYLFRDLKPENVMIDKKGELKLYDYGLCLPLNQAASGVSNSDSIEGSPFYLPPERVVGAFEGEYSEIYSLGMVVFHMLTGKTYYSEAEIKDLITKHVTSLRISSVETHLKHCTSRTVDIIDKMIKRKPNDRYHSFSVLKADIEDLISVLESNENNLVHSAPPEVLSDDIAKRKLKNKVFMTSVLFAIFAILVSLLIFRTVRDSKLRKEAILKVSTQLGISPDVKSPVLTADEIKKQVAENISRELNIFKTTLPQFNESDAKKKSANELGIKIPPQSPQISSLSKLEEKRLAEIKYKEQKITESLSKKYAFDENSAKDQILKKVGLNENLPKPECSLGQALEKLEDYSKTKAAEKFSNKEQAKREMELYNQLRPFRIGEYVKTVEVSGKPVEGTFDRKSGGKVVVGGREILLNDIPATHRFRFDEAQAEKRAKEQLESFRKNFQNQKRDFQEKIIKEEKESFLKNLGFIKTGKDDFMLPDEFIRQEIEKLREKNNEELKKKIIEEKKKIAKEMAQENYFKNNGFCKYQNKWMTEKEALDNLVEDKRKKFDSDIQKKISDKTKSLTTEFEKKLYSSNGYVYYNNSWQPAKDLLNKFVEMELSAK